MGRRSRGDWFVEGVLLDGKVYMSVDIKERKDDDVAVIAIRDMTCCPYQPAPYLHPDQLLTLPPVPPPHYPLISLVSSPLEPIFCTPADSAPPTRKCSGREDTSLRKERRQGRRYEAGPRPLYILPLNTRARSRKLERQKRVSSHRSRPLENWAIRML